MPAPEQPSKDLKPLCIHAGLFLASATFLYYSTWRLLVAFGWTPWLAPALVAETYLLIAGAYVLGVWRPARNQRIERREIPRVQMSMPVRYATEDGQVGVGVLVDVHATGAALILPKMTFDSDRLWMQSVWFDDRAGIQGRVIYTKETPEGLRLGLQLQSLNPESLDLLFNFIIPIGRRRFIQNGRSPISLLNPHVGRGRWEYLPVHVEQDGRQVWAMTEDMNETGAVLLLPQRLRESAPVKIGVWGSQHSRECMVVLSETLRLPRSAVHRVMVQYVGAPSPQPDQDTVGTPVVHPAPQPVFHRSRTTF